MAAIGLIAIVAIGPIADDDSFFDTDAFLVVGAVAVALGFAGLLAAPRGTRLRGMANGFGVGILVSLAAYFCPPGIDGRGDFQFRALLALALTAAVLWIVNRPGESLTARLCGGVVGVVAPPVLLVALLAVTCSDECFS